jgi:uncharacterized membrane protein YhiD involved in acid resistance
MFDFLSANQNIGVGMILLNIGLSFALSLLIAWIYQKTHRGLSYSQSLVVGLVLLCVLASIIMMVIGNVLIRAVALLGAFTIIRFRTAIKDPKDVSFILFSLIIGMAVGTGSYAIGVVSTVMISLIAYILNRINFGSGRRHDYVLTFSLDKEKAPSDVYEPIFEKYLKSYDLLNINTREEGRIIDLTFNLKFLNGVKADKLIEELSVITGLKNVNLIMAKNDIEY